MPAFTFPFYNREYPGLLDVIIAVQETGCDLFRDRRRGLLILSAPERFDPSTLPSWLQRGIKDHKHALLQRLPLAPESVQDFFSHLAENAPSQIPHLQEALSGTDFEDFIEDVLGGDVEDAEDN